MTKVMHFWFWILTTHTFPVRLTIGRRSWINSTILNKSKLRSQVQYFGMGSTTNFQD